MSSFQISFKLTKGSKIAARLQCDFRFDMGTAFIKRLLQVQGEQGERRKSCAYFSTSVIDSCGFIKGEQLMCSYTQSVN